MINKVSISIWDRVFILPVEYDCYNNESVTEAQIRSLDNFLLHQEWIGDSRNKVETYCREQVLSNDGNMDNIFNYIKPDYIFVKRLGSKAKVSLMCKYKYDPEHGIAICFSPKGKVSIDKQEAIL